MLIYITLFEATILPCVNYKYYKFNFLFFSYDLVLIYGSRYKNYVIMCFTAVLVITILYGIFIFTYYRKPITLVINTRNNCNQIDNIQKYFNRNNILVEINNDQVNKVYVKLNDFTANEAKSIKKEIRLVLKKSSKYRCTNIFYIMNFMILIVFTVYLFYLTL